MSKHFIVRAAAVVAVLALAFFLVTALKKKLHDPGVTAPAVAP